MIANGASGDPTRHEWERSSLTGGAVKPNRLKLAFLTRLRTVSGLERTPRQCLVSDGGMRKLSSSGSVPVVAVSRPCSGAATDRIVRTKTANSSGPAVKASHASTGACS